ncbi:MAG: glycoside hydrolase family 13 protein [Oscillospiraceae bacterium]|jgi:glycosidase|nr:glycoside hydrolase family 13 protein [Oscillospiraceae bacterium]
MGYSVFDSFSKFHKTPFGAVRRNEQVTFKLKFPTYQKVEQLMLAIYRPGEKEKFIPFRFDGIEERAFGVYICEFAPQFVGLHFYYFTCVQNGGRVHIKRENASEGSERGSMLWQLTVFNEKTYTPDWLKGGIIYQIFPDRFARINADDDTPTPIDRDIHDHWNDIPDWRPNSEGKITNSDYFGGNLSGVRFKLPYLHSLGVTCVYLCPIFESHENHRYCTANYERIDPMLGTEDDFKLLCVEAAELGINIIIDGVFSHTGADSVYFNKFGRYGDKTGAYRDPESPYREWYSFIKYPSVYESWWGIETLPNVNENSPSYTKYICGDDGILQRWLDAGARGWRLDVADELPDEFIDNLNKAVKAKGDDKIIFGEVWEDATTKESYGIKRRYLIGGQLDSVMNYPFKDLIINYIKYGDAARFRDGVMVLLENYPKPSVDTLMNFISTHDVERAITLLGGEPVGNHDRAWQAEHALSDRDYIYGAALLRCAMVLQYFLPGVPCIYYGDEAGVEGYKDPFNRRTYPWGREDETLLQFARELGRIRHNCGSFVKGQLRFLSVEPDSCAFLRYDDKLGEAAAVYMNRSKFAKRFEVECPDCVVTKVEPMRVSRTIYEQIEKFDAGFVKVAPYSYSVIKFKYNI